MNHDFCGTYPTNSHIKFKTIMLKSRLCSYINAYILVKGSVSVGNTTVENVNTNKIYKK